MNVTQEEARRCWCPFARVAHPFYDKINAQDGGAPIQISNRIVATQEDASCAEMAADHPAMKCIASHCMAWRFHENVATGYCGLAGKP